jgi:glucan phosphorylase
LIGVLWAGTWMMPLTAAGTGLGAPRADRIVNKTNGINFRRWLMQANPGLSKLLREVCGAAVLDDQTMMVRLADHANDASLQARFGGDARRDISKLTQPRLPQSDHGAPAIE